MTWHADVAELLAEAGMTDSDPAFASVFASGEEAVADGHVRSAVYQRVVSVIASSGSRDRDRAVVAAILRGPDETASKGAVVALVDEIALRTTGAAEFRQWSDGLLPEIDRLRVAGFRDFIRRRVRDWLLYLSVGDGHVPTRAELAEVTEWMQRFLAERATSPAVLAVLAGSAATRKTRNIAKHRAARHR
ncbi:hypothetical protein AB0I16_08000 [Streptomyces sp. NPDC050703]|uniref:hypothetical protein n=1 Tax=Streptomyces sp. NPDC050703 TaxID=3157218 RepID=UPI00341562AB